MGKKQDKLGATNMGVDGWVPSCYLAQETPLLCGCGTHSTPATLQVKG